MKQHKSYLSKWDRLSAIFVILLGTLNHFLYDLSGGLALAALFCPVNESTWEHLKLLFFPFLLVTLWTWIRIRPQTLPFFYSRYLGVLSGMLWIIISFYTYTGVLGRNFLIFDLAIFVIGVWLSFVISARLYRHQKSVPPQELVFSLWIITALCFFAFTCYPPNLPLFFPPNIV